MKYSNLIYILLVNMFLTSCGEPDYPTPTPSVNTLIASKLTVVHTRAEGPRVQVKVDNRITAKDTVRYEKAPDGKLYNTITINVPAGPNRVLGYTELATGALLVNDRYSATSGLNFTAFVSRNANGTPRIVRVSDDLTLPDVGFAKIRFLNFSPDVGEVKLTDVGGATTVISGRNFNETTRSTTDFARFTAVPAGTYSYEVRTVVGDEVRVTINNLKLDSKGIYTIYVKGLLAGAGDVALDYGTIKH
jgi:hypothetical protein